MEPPKDQPPSSAYPPSGSCNNCGGPTISEPAPQASLPDMSPPPNYRPIRAPAINVPHNPQAIILSPVPHAEKVPVVTPPYQFQRPVKRIHSPDDIRRFQESASFKNFLGFVSQSSRPCCDGSTRSLLFQCPLDTVTSRLGHGTIASLRKALVHEFLPDEFKESTIEIVPYLFDSFGNASRIDYGTGHETNFAAWLYCLAKMGIIKEEDYHAVVARVFVKYLELMRKLQMVYCLEPAGSHGVWGLDDYHFLPFIFGSSQLIDHKYMKPKSIHNDDILDNFSSEYMYLSCIGFVKKVKKGLFAEHSPLLDDISGVPNWKKVNSGLLKMYKVDVLQKVPIMQHFLFGWLIKWYDSSFVLSRFLSIVTSGCIMWFVDWVLYHGTD
ncbi:hypothetical protein Bca101_031486 [Brassica carinata]